MKKKLLAILLTVCMVISMAPAALAAETNPFTDVSVDDWYYDEVQYVYENDLMKGTSTTTFSPDVTVNRAMMVTILYRLEGAPAVSTTGSFTDVPAGQYYTDAVEWAKENKITAGYGGGLFGPNDLLTREQMATFFYRYAEFKGYDVSAAADLSDYTDLATVGSYALDAFKWTNANGLIKGTTTTTLSPKGDATRGQLAVILYRFCENVVADVAETHTVTFDYNYSNKGTYTTVSVKDGDKVEKPNNPTRSSYSFGGWYTKVSGGSKFDFDTVITADLTLYARWSYNGGGGGGSSHSHSWVAGTPVAPTCTSEGYTPYTCVCGASKNGDPVAKYSHVAGVKCPHCGVIEVADEAQLIAAAQGDGEVKIKMIANITVDVAAWQTNALGGASTTSIVIDGDNGDADYTLTFNQTNSDWNNVVTSNDAKLVLKNMNITNSGHNDGPWNRHDINFGCDVEMENVNSDKALAFKADAALTNVTIDDANTSDTYAIWIQPNGQTVTLNGCTIDMLDATDGRGIKIDEQYVGAPSKVTLSVSNATFKTEEKAAILVKSVAGADITLSNVDISGVVADSENHVWIDEDSAAYQQLVTVAGGKKILEGAVAKIGDMYYSTLQEAVDAAVDGDTIIISEGEYDEVIDVRGGKTFTVKAEEVGTVVLAGINQQTNGDAASTVTFENLTIDNSKATEGWFTGTAQNIFPCVGAWGGNLSFENCTFKVAGTSKKETGIMTWWTTNKVTLSFNECTFNGIDDHASARAMQIYGNVDMTVTDCEFNTYKDYTLKYVGNEGCTATLSGNKVYNSENFVELGSSTYPGSKYTVYLNDNTLGENVGNFVIANPENQIVYVDGAQAITSADELAAALCTDAETINVVLYDDIDLPINSLGSITPSSGEYKLGGENTTAITIDLNDKTLNITTGYWSAIGCKNADATITVKNGSMVSTGNSAATWNANDLRFSNCNWEFENVVFNKEVALDNAGKSTTMKTVTINGTGDYYALWITAEGQTVNIDSLTVNTSGRGIKIDEQYVSSPAKVTLNVSNSEFTTAKKAAILVKSAAGADITLSNADISGVSADTTNAVWVDSDAATYADLVTVTGATKIVES